MAIEIHPVFSTSTKPYCNAIGYDAETTEMEVHYDNGRISIYGPGIIRDIFDACLNKVVGGSTGKTINTLVKGQYQHRYK